jgi:hypothetical protein
MCLRTFKSGLIAAVLGLAVMTTGTFLMNVSVFPEGMNLYSTDIEQTTTDLATNIPALALTGVGGAIYFVGLAFVAASKGRNPAWGFAAFLSFIGVVIVLCLQDRRQVLDREVR